MAARGLFYIEALVSDLQRSKAFYRDTLGWELNTDLPTVAGLYFGTGYLVLVADTRPASSRQYAGGMQVEVQVDDVNIEHARLKAKSVDCTDISEKPWGERKFSFTDPDGYVWSYGQSV